MKIKFADINDINGIRDLLLEQHTYHQKLQDQVFDKTDKFVLITDKWLLEIIESTSTHFVICEMKQAAVGLLMFSEKKTDNDSYHTKNWLYIEEMIVADSARRKGIGKALMIFIEDYARKKGVSIIKLDVWNNNQDAINFYLNNDYREKKIELWKQLDE